MPTITVKIEITDSNGRVSRTFEDNINPSMSIRELRKKWQDAFSVDIQSVRFNNQVLTDDTNSNFYNILNGSTIVLFTEKSDDQINLVVEVQSINPNQGTIQLKVNSNITTGELMGKIKHKISFNFDSAYLTHHGQRLSDGKSLNEQKVKNNDVIQVLVTTRGGLNIHN